LSTLRQSSEMPPWLTDVGQQLDTLSEAGIGTIIFHKDQIGADRIEHWRRYLSLAPIYEDERIAVFTTQHLAGQDFQIQQELKPGLGPVHTLVTGDCFAPGQPLEVDILWGTSSGPQTDYQVQIALQNQAGERLQPQSFPLANQDSSSAWPANALVWGYYPFEIEPDLASGQYELLVWLGEDSSTEPFSLGPLTIKEDGCPAALPEQATSIDALFDDQMRLLGYEVQRPTPEQLNITLYWRGEQRMADDYKVFVHVFNQDTGIPVAQDDAMPHRGGFPTRFWAPGDLIVDHISINLAQAPAGEFGLAIGVYDPLTQERLPLTIEGEQMPDDRRLMLPNEKISVQR
jgi:hypothetical protein